MMPRLPAEVAAMSEQDAQWMRQALELAERAQHEDDEIPVGAVVVGADGSVLGQGWNRNITECDPTAHAEIVAMRQAGNRIGNHRLVGCTLYVTLEPCAMCAAALYWRGVRRVVFALSSEGLRRITGSDPASPHLAISCREVFAHANHEVEVSGPQLEEQARAVHEGFWG